MRIVLIGTGVLKIPPEKGGAIEKLIYEIAKYVSKFHESYVVDFENSTTEFKKIVVKHKPFRHKILSMLSEFLFGLKSLKVIEKIQPHVVHVQTVFTGLVFALTKKPYIYTCHNPAWSAKKIDLLNRIVKLIEKLVIKRAKVVIALSPEMRRQIKRVNKNVIEISNFIDFDEFYISKKQRNTVLFVGKLTKTKGIHIFLEAAKLALKNRKHLKFLIVGSKSFIKEDYKYWEKYAERLGIKKHVKFYGLVSRNKLKKLYALSEVFCLPTSREGMPLVILEALASGCKVVTTRISGIENIINEKNGIVVKRNAKEIARGIAKMLDASLNPREIRNTVKKFE